MWADLIQSITLMGSWIYSLCLKYNFPKCCMYGCFGITLNGPENGAKLLTVGRKVSTYQQWCRQQLAVWFAIPFPGLFGSVSMHRPWFQSDALLPHKIARWCHFQSKAIDFLSESVPFCYAVIMGTRLKAKRSMSRTDLWLQWQWRWWVEMQPAQIE